MVCEVREGFRQEEAFNLIWENGQGINQLDKEIRTFQALGSTEVQNSKACLDWRKNIKRNKG